MISEAKLDNTFPVFKFYTNGFCILIRLDRVKMEDGIMFLVTEAIPTKSVTTLKS